MGFQLEWHDQAALLVHLVEAYKLQSQAASCVANFSLAASFMAEHSTGHLQEYHR